MNAFSQTLWSSISGQDWPALLAATFAKGVLLLAALWLLLSVWRRASASMRHWLWLLALLSLALVPLRTARVAVWTVPLWKPALANNEIASVTGELSGGPATPQMPKIRIEAATRHAEKSESPAQARKSHRANFNFSDVVFFIWLAGVLFFLSRMAFARWSVRQLEKSALPITDENYLQAMKQACDQLGLRRHVRLLEGSNSLLPMTWGFWQPVILLPGEAKNWSEERRQIVLLHELAYVKRRDCGTRLLAQLLCALHWFNPFAWLAARQMAIERERACDDLVLGTGTAPSAYAGHLLEIARSFRVGSLASGAAIAIARPPQIAGRIVAIVDARRNRRRVTWRASALSILVVSAFVGAPSLIHLRAQTVNEAKYDRLKPFFAAKEKQVRALMKQETNTPSTLITAYFEAAAKGNWPSVTNFYGQMWQRRAHQFEGAKNPDPVLETMAWQPVLETYGMLEQFALGEEKCLRAFGQDIINSIPAGSIYFGGTDPGRFIITGLSKSHEDADPFFTLSQNGLTDGGYLKYLRTMYGGRIYTPTAEDHQAAFDEYLADAEARLKKGQLRPGEDVRIVDGKTTVQGQMSVVGVRSLLAKKIFDKNADREFYIEESFPLEWMYPHLTPHGLILKLNRQPLAEIADALVRTDHEYWHRHLAPIIGDWLTEDTSVAELCRRVEKVFVEKDFSAYGGDPKFLANDYSCKMYSKLRSAQSGVYLWRAMQAFTNPAEKQRMTSSADFGFRQAYALCPYSPEALYRYVQLLAGEHRFDEALLLAKTSSKIEPTNNGLQQLIRELERLNANSLAVTAPGVTGQPDAELKTLEARHWNDPFDLTTAIALTQKYAQAGRTNEVLRIADTLVEYPQADAASISFAAQVYQQLANYPKLETALARWVQLTPTPEAWLDYAASQAVQKKGTEALASLRQALTLNEARLQKNPQDSDIRPTLKNDPRFVSLRSNPEFQKLTAAAP